MDKTLHDPDAAVADIPDGATLAVGGLRALRHPARAHRRPRPRRVQQCGTVTNNCGVDGGVRLNLQPLNS
ncbi:MAG: hypothetical protein L0I76_37680 [Pseudonocardia sp.]|nr:hypothetical protein [Pseudonocardia sp.]